MMLLASCDTNGQWDLMTKKSCCISFGLFDGRNVMVLLFMPVTSHNPTAVPMESHDQEGNLAPHFDLLELANAVVPLTIPCIT